MMKMMICSMILMLLSIFLFMFNLFFMMYNKIMIIEWMIYSLNSMKFNLFIMIDDLSLMFISLVFYITSMVMIYSLSYMFMEEYKMKRFYYLTLFFMISMCFMIISPNMLTILLGWDGLGLISYCLIIFYQSQKAFSSGMLTIILNRIGDSSLLMLICLMIINGSWNLLLYKMNFIIMMMLMLMMMTKSAQFPFSSWLPAAMMAPTPISALVHSSTLVTAGVYLFIRYSDLLLIEVNYYILMISSLTMMYSGLMANYEMDFKKIIALSTLSQLGFMMSILLLGMKDLAYLHMIIHAMFKSLMFLCVGSFIHYMNNMQDLRSYSGMFKISMFKSLIMMFTSMSLCGFPFLVGFYSKDLIMEEFFSNKLNLLVIMNLMLGTVFTVSYSIRILLIVFMNSYLKFKVLYKNDDNLMNLCMSMMMLFTLYYSKIFLNFKLIYLNLNMSLIFKLMVMKLCLLGIILGINMYMCMNNKKMNKISYMFKEMIFMNKFYNYIYYKPLINIYLYELIIEKNLIEILSKLVMIILSLLNFNYMSMKFYSMLMLYLFMFIFLIMII